MSLVSGRDSLSYLGVVSTNPPQLIEASKSPGFNDRQGYSIGDLWVVKNKNQIFILVSLAQSKALWVNLFPGGGGALIFNANTGTATPSGGILNMFGDTNVTTTGSGSQITISMSNGSNGQLLFGGGSAAAWNDLTSLASTITITKGSHTLNLEVTSLGTVVTTFVTNDAAMVHPDGNNRVNIVGGDNINTSGSGSTVTVNLDSSIIIPGTITIQSLGAGVVQSSSSGLLSSNYGTNGQLLISSSTLAPAWKNITSTGSTVTITNTANHINVESSSSGNGVATFQFMANQTANLDNVIGNSANTYSLGSSAALSIIFDVGSNVYPGDGLGTPAVFTAPVSGTYYLSMHVNFNITDYIGTSLGRMIISTNKRDYTLYFSPASLFAGSPGLSYNGVWQHYVIANMDSGNTALFQVNIGHPSPSANIHGIYNNLTYISGYYLGV